MTDDLFVNEVILTGRAGKDPDVRYFESGSVLAKLTIAVDRPPKGGEKQEPDWFELEIWGKAAEVAANYVHKGDQVGVGKGRFKFEFWTDKNTGKERSAARVVVEELILMGKGRSQQSSPPPEDVDYPADW